MVENDTLRDAATFFAFVLAGLYAYLKSPKAANPPLDPAIKSIGMEWGNKEQMERLVEQVKRIADTLQKDEQDAMKETMDELLEELKRQGR